MGGWLGKPGGIFLLRADGMPEPDRRLFSAVAKVVLLGDLGDLVSQPSGRHPGATTNMMSRGPRISSRLNPPPHPLRSRQPSWKTGSAVSRATAAIRRRARRRTRDAAPWSNVLANPSFGTIVSSSGSAFTWAGNSRENRLTPFANDPLSDPTGKPLPEG